jgi:antirestriction protein ArdC
MQGNERKDVYARVTGRIVADLEQGVRPWLKPWNADHAAGKITRPLRHNGAPYRGVNVLLLWGEAVAQGYASPFWMTYRQSQQIGGQVRKGEHGALVVYANTVVKTGTDEDGEEIERELSFMKAYTVFNAGQIEGLPSHYYAQPGQPLPLPERIENAERFIAATGAEIRYGGTRAYYAPGPDRIQLPPFEAFQDKESFYSVALHELTHWSKAPTRLNRDFGAKRFGDSGYAREELVAELGAAFLCADLGITPEVRADHAAYLDHWIQLWRGEHNWINREVSIMRRKALGARRSR